MEDFYELFINFDKDMKITHTLTLFPIVTVIMNTLFVEVVSPQVFTYLVIGNIFYILMSTKHFLINGLGKFNNDEVFMEKKDSIEGIGNILAMFANIPFILGLAGYINGNLANNFAIISALLSLNLSPKNPIFYEDYNAFGIPAELICVTAILALSVRYNSGIQSFLLCTSVVKFLLNTAIYFINDFYGDSLFDDETSYLAGVGASVLFLIASFIVVAKTGNVEQENIKKIFDLLKNQFQQIN